VCDRLLVVTSFVSVRYAASMRSRTAMEVLLARCGSGSSPVVVRVKAPGTAAVSASIERGERLGKGTKATAAITLPKGLSIAAVKCLEQERDQYLYAFLLQVRMCSCCTEAGVLSWGGGGGGDAHAALRADLLVLCAWATSLSVPWTNIGVR